MFSIIFIFALITVSDCQIGGCRPPCICSGSIAFCYGAEIKEWVNFTPDEWIIELGYINTCLSEFPLLNEYDLINLRIMTIEDSPFISCADLDYFQIQRPSVYIKTDIICNSSSTGLPPTQPRPTIESSTPPRTTEQSSSPPRTTEESSSPPRTTKESSSPPRTTKESSSPPRTTTKSSIPTRTTTQPTTVHQPTTKVESRVAKILPSIVIPITVIVVIFIIAMIVYHTKKRNRHEDSFISMDNPIYVGETTVLKKILFSSS